jgi:outer membrane murein-binding lipoprotein Lpp
MKNKGSVNIAVLAKVFLVVFIILLFIPLLLTYFSSYSVSNAISVLEKNNYIVFAASEYEDLNDKVDSLIAKVDSVATKADAAVETAQNAVTAAENAVNAAELAAGRVDLFNTAERFVFPATTNITCTLTAGNTNVWGNWAQITDSGGGNLSSVFLASTGYITDMQIFDHSAADKIYLVEIAYGVAKNIIGRVAYHTSFADNVDIKSELIPVGEIVYYRMMSSGANGATARVGFRYIYE